MKRPLTIGEQADMADSDMKYDKMYYQALGDNWREELAQRTKSLYAINSHCGVCKRHIEDVSVAILWEPSNSPPMLLCNDAVCNVKAIIGRATQAVA